MNNMNPVYQELASLRKSKEIEAETRQIRLQKEAAKAATSLHGAWTAHRIAHLAEWMISTGESLRQRYNHAAMHGKSHTRALAH